MKSFLVVKHCLCVHTYFRYCYLGLAAPNNEIINQNKTKDLMYLISVFRNKMSSKTEKTDTSAKVHVRQFKSCIARKSVFRVSRSETNWAVQLQKMARGLKFGQCLEYTYSKNKGADQLRNYC